MKPKIERIKEEIIYLTHINHKIAMKVSLELLEKEFKKQANIDMKNAINRHIGKSVIWDKIIDRVLK